MTVSLPTIGSGRVIWHLGDPTAKSDESFQASSAEFQQAVHARDLGYSPRGIGPDGFESPRLSLGRLFPIDVKSSTPGTSGEQGTGLGLILCKELVEKNGGKIWIESEIDKGTTFKFTLLTLPG
jgi:hypothetical protein